MNLNQEQEEIYNKVLKSTQHVCVTGPGGVGKSVLVDIFRETLNHCQVLAPTGIAALNVGGMTIHRFFGLLPHIRTIDDYIRLKKNYYSKVPWHSLKFLIIDEISMISPEMFELVDAICRLHKRNKIPFGGIRLLLFGDWCQLPPIINSKTWGDKSSDKLSNSSDLEIDNGGLNGSANSPTFIHEMDLFKRMNMKMYELKQVMRQTDVEFINFLHKIRVGDTSEEVLEYISGLEKNVPEIDKHYIKLYAKNVDKNYSNEIELAKLPGECKIYAAIDKGEKKYLTGHRVEETVLLKVGAAVMLLWNMPEHNLFNGSIGKVIELQDTVGVGEGGPTVKFDNGTILKIVPRLFEVIKKSDGRFNVLASRVQIPLGLAYGITIHKSQSQSFDRVEVFCDGIFSKGMLYTALSRARTANNLIVHDFRTDYVM